MSIHQEIAYSMVVNIKKIIENKKPKSIYNQIVKKENVRKNRKENFEISEDKAKSLNLLKKSITNLKNCSMKKQAKNIVFSDGNTKSKFCR